MIARQVLWKTHVRYLISWWVLVVHSFAHKTAQVNRPTKLVITIAYIFRGSCAATDSLCIFAFFGYDTPSPPGCDYRAPTGAGRAHMLTGRPKSVEGKRAGPGRNLIGPRRAVEFRPVQTCRRKRAERRTYRYMTTPRFLFPRHGWIRTELRWCPNSSQL